jgi:predicted ester cyclase
VTAPRSPFTRAGWRGFPDLRFDETDTPCRTADGADVARMRGTMRGPIDPPGFAPAGRAMEVEGVDLWTLRDGRIARYRAFYDMNDLARRLAIAPAPGSRAEKAVVALQHLQARMLRRSA